MRYCGTGSRFLFDTDCAEYKYYEYRVAQEEAALAPEAGGSAAPYTGWTGIIRVFPKKLHFGVMEHCFCTNSWRIRTLLLLVHCLSPGVPSRHPFVGLGLVCMTSCVCLNIGILIFQGVVAMLLAIRAVILGNLVEGKIRGIRLQHPLCTVEGTITEGPLTPQGLLKSLH